MKHLFSVLLNLGLLFSTQLGQAQAVFATEEKIALNGYDVVAYHTAYQAIEGNQAHSARHQGYTYYFATVANKTTFEQAPEKYLPEYGGYCAFAVAAKNATVPADPQTFKIRDGKLYLFFNDLYEGKPFNTIIPWNAQEPEMISKADANWASMK